MWGLKTQPSTASCSCLPLAAFKAAPVWFGACDQDAKLHLDAPSVFKAFLSKFAGKRVRLRLELDTPVRSKNANKYWWGVVIPCIADELGYLPHEHEAVHDAVVRHLVGLRPCSDPRLQIRQSTHDMDRDDFGVLIESAVIWAATELGIVIPDPDKQWHMKPKTRAA